MIVLVQCAYSCGHGLAICVVTGQCTLVLYACTGKMWRVRSRWRSMARDLCVLAVGVMVGVCISHFTDFISCSRRTTDIRQAGGHNFPLSGKLGKVVQQKPLNRTQQNDHAYPQVPRDVPPVHINQHQTSKRVKRPKYLKDELALREPLYVGVVTAKSFLNTRAMDINGTWAHKLSKVEYFVAEGQGSHPLSVVGLKGVDDSYPPQKKVYRMLQYMHDNYIDKYNWFLRADDDAYMRVPELLNFLSALDPNVALYIGSPGLGKPEDLDRIKLLPHERYCMGGPGVIFSRAMLIQLVPFLDDCLDNVVVSYNEDLEVGRCISRKLDIQCTWAYEVS